MDHTKFRDFTFSYIISRFCLENIDVPFLSSNGSVVYKRTSYHAKGLVYNHKNCFAAILFPSFFCNIRRIAPRFDWTFDVARRVAPRFRQLRSVALRHGRRASADLDRGLRRSRSPSAFFASLSNLVELYRSSLLEFYRNCQTIRLDFCRNLSNNFPCFSMLNM